MEKRKKKKEIINTLNYYKEDRGQNDFDIPSLKDISRLIQININCVFPFAKIDHNISAEVRPNFFLHVNANAFDYIQKLAKDYSELKRGDLFKFTPGVDLCGLWFLPDYVMKGMQQYKWDKHKSQIDKWLGVGERELSELERKGVIHRSKRN